jgi:hypothetical protein
MKKILMAAVMVLTMVSWASAGHALRPLSADTAGWRDATHEVVITHDMLTEATSNTVQILTNLFTTATTQQVELVSVELTVPFEYSTTNALNSVKLQIGDGNSTNRYLTWTELGAYGTYVPFSLGTLPSISTSAVAIAGGTGVVASVTYNAGAKVLYTTKDTVDFAFIAGPAVGYALSDLNRGEVHIYFRLRP